MEIKVGDQTYIFDVEAFEKQRIWLQQKEDEYLRYYRQVMDDIDRSYDDDISY